MKDNTEKENLVKVEITFSNSEKVEKPTILQILKKKGVDVNFQCVEGYCGTCKCPKPTEGGIKNSEGYDDSNIIGYYDKDEEFLPCVSKIDLNSIQFDENGKGKIVFHFPESMVREKTNTLEDANKKFIEQSKEFQKEQKQSTAKKNKI